MAQGWRISYLGMRWKFSVRDEPRSCQFPGEGRNIPGRSRFALPTLHGLSGEANISYIPRGRIDIRDLPKPQELHLRSGPGRS